MVVNRRKNATIPQPIVRNRGVIFPIAITPIKPRSHQLRKPFEDRDRAEEGEN